MREHVKVGLPVWILEEAYEDGILRFRLQYSCVLELIGARTFEHYDSVDQYTYDKYEHHDLSQFCRQQQRELKSKVKLEKKQAS